MKVWICNRTQYEFTLPSQLRLLDFYEVFPGNGKPLVIRVIFLPHDAPQSAVILSVGIDLKEELGGSAAEMFEILPRKLKADFHSKMNVCRHELGGSTPQPQQFQQWLNLLTFVYKQTFFYITRRVESIYTTQPNEVTSDNRLNYTRETVNQNDTIVCRTYDISSSWGGTGTYLRP